jgi:NAD(P)-dependent dehydrogenase (short-subunit alcohol dehydrogenase family)
VVHCDVSQADDVNRLRDEVMARYGAVHFVYLNAGVVIAGPVDELSLEAWEWTLGVDLWGPIHGVRAFLPILRQQDEAHIFATASTCGLQAAPGIGPYNVAKFGVVALMETVAHELGPHSNVGVTVLTPGAVDTRIAYSDRSMPDAVRAVHRSSDIEDRFLATSRSLLAEKGMAPAAVADLVFQAARERRFWIVTHSPWLDVVENRVAGMRANGELRAGFGG